METPLSLPDALDSSAQTPASTPVIKTEARKIIITQLPHTTTSAELTNLLVKEISKGKYKLSIGSPSRATQEVTIAVHSDGKPKGHAFAVFETHQIAKYVINTLHGQKFQGRVLNARFAKEGAEPWRKQSPLVDPQFLPPRLERQPMASTSSSSPNRSASKSTQSRDILGEPCLAQGPTPPTSRSESKLTEEVSQHRPKSNDAPRPRSSFVSAPLVADGSSSRGNDGKSRKSRG